MKFKRSKKAKKRQSCKQGHPMWQGNRYFLFPPFCTFPNYVFLALTFSIPEESVFNITWVSVKQNLGGFSPILNWKSTMAFNLRGIGGRRPEKRFGWLGKLLLTLAMHSKLLCGKWHKCKYSDKYKYKYIYNANTNTDWGNYY